MKIPWAIVSYCLLAILGLAQGNPPETMLLSVKAAAAAASPSSLLTNLVSYWKMEETSGTRYDSVGTNHLADFNTVGYGTGIVGYAADLESDNDEYLNAEDSPELTPTSGTMTICWWMKLESPYGKQSGGYIYPVSKNLSINGYRSYFIRIATNTYNLEFYASGNGSSVTGRTMTSNHHGLFGSDWHHLAYVVDGEKMWFYVDCTKWTNIAYTSGIFDNTNFFQIGRMTGAPGQMDGLFDEVGLWSRALTSNEIYNHMIYTTNGTNHPWTGLP